MKDMICIDNGGVEGALTIGKVYKVDESKSDRIGSRRFYYVEGDMGFMAYFYENRFEEFKKPLYEVDLI